MEVLNSLPAQSVGVENRTTSDAVQQSQQAQRTPQVQRQSSVSSESAANNTSSLTPVRSDNLSSASALSVSADVSFSIEDQSGNTSIAGNVSVTVRLPENALSEGDSLNINIDILAGFGTTEAASTDFSQYISDQDLQALAALENFNSTSQGSDVSSSIFSALYGEETSGDLLTGASNVTQQLESGTALSSTASDVLSVNVNVELTLPESFSQSVQPNDIAVAQNAAAAANPANVRGPDLPTVDIAV